jgi:hypothetical protein
VTSMGDWVFNGCDSITSITFLSTTPPTIQLSYYPTLPSHKTYTIYVPAESVDAYKGAWKKKASQIEAIQ